MRDTLRVVRAQEYRQLWERAPGTLGTAFWIAAIALLGWDNGLWAGALVVIVLTVLSRTMPSSWRAVELTLDLCYHSVMRSLILRMLWLLLIVDLWFVQNRGPWSLPMVLALFVAALLLPFATRQLLLRPIRRVLRTAC